MYRPTSCVAHTELQWIETVLGCDIIDVHALAYMSAMSTETFTKNYLLLVQLPAERQVRSLLPQYPTQR